MLRNRVAGRLQHCYQGLQENQIGGVNDFLIPTPESGLKPEKSENPKNRPKSDHQVNNKCEEIGPRVGPITITQAFKNIKPVL